MQFRRNIRRLFCLAYMQVSWLTGHCRFSAFPEFITPVASLKIHSLLTVAVPHRILTGFPFHLPAGQSKTPALRHMKAYSIDFRQYCNIQTMGLSTDIRELYAHISKETQEDAASVWKSAQSWLSDSCTGEKPAIPLALDSLTA